MIWLASLSLILAITATADDLRRRKIANPLTLAGFAAGLAAHAALYGFGGVANSLLGGVIGFSVFLIFFLIGGMGAGDIKLMAAFGAIVGRRQIVLAAMLTAMVGGVMALAYLAGKKIWRLCRPGTSAFALPDHKAALPYAPAISLGVLLSYLNEDELWTEL